MVKLWKCSGFIAATLYIRIETNADLQHCLPGSKPIRIRIIARLCGPKKWIFTRIKYFMSVTGHKTWYKSLFKSLEFWFVCYFGPFSLLLDPNLHSLYRSGSRRAKSMQSADQCCGSGSGIRIRIGSVFNRTIGSGSVIWIRIRIQEDKNDPQK